ncbi:MAG: hypothetical protein AAFZ63_20640 [Bacteroidota bacterium]
MISFNPLQDITHNEYLVKIVEDKQERISPFIEISKEKEEQVSSPLPQEAREAINEVRRRRIAIFQESTSLDNYWILRQIAFEIAQDGLYKVKELATSLPHQQLLPILERETSGTIFLLGVQTPKTLNYELTKLAKIANQKNFWFLVRTDLSRELWDATLYTCSLEPATFDQDELAAYLTSLMSKQLSDLQIGKLTEELVQKFNDQAYIRELCQVLKTPVQIDLFLQHLINYAGPLNLQSLEYAREAALETNHSPLIRSFKMQNDHRRLIALGLVLFDGLYDDQFFSAMNYLARKSWSGRAEQLQALDYCDLEAVSSFFNYNNIVGDERFIQHKSPDQRRAIIEYAWNSYRRHLLSALPIMAELVIQSATSVNSNWELFGNKEKRIRLRSSIADTISDLGLKAPESVEHTLIQLAAHRAYVVQAVAASALARWYRKGQHELFFEVIEKWQKDEKFINLVMSILQERNPGQARLRYRAMDHIKATILLTLGEAAKVHESGTPLHPKIITALEHALAEKSELVIARYSQILPQVVELHLEEFWSNKLLSQLINQDYLVYSVALGIAYAQERSPELVEQLFNKWLPIVNNSKHWSSRIVKALQQGWLQRLWSFFFGNAATESNERSEEEKLNLRDRVAITLILCCQELAFREKPEQPTRLCGMTPYEILFNFRQREQNQIVKTICLKVLVSLLSSANDEVARHLVTAQDSFTEQFITARHLAQRYLRERQNLTGGDEELVIRKRSYSIWIPKETRPDVPIEKIVKEWLISGSAEQKQVGLLALDQFIHRLEAKEDKLVREVLYEQELNRKEQEPENGPGLSLSTLLKSQFHNLIYLFRKWWVTTFKSAETTGTLQALAPLLKSYNFSAKSLALIAEKLKMDEEIPDELPQGIEQLYKISDR